MAGQKDMDYVYTLIDRVFRLTIGESGDFSGAMYNGDFSMSLEQAQEQKHRFICEQLAITRGSKVLDMGCGWGPFLKYIKAQGAEGTGLTLSHGQAEACARSGLKALIMDCRAVTPETIGTFDAVASLGAFEHFCSIEDWQAGGQEEIYKRFFRTVSGLLPVGGRFYLQTMVFGRNMIDYPQIDIRADRNSTAYLLAVMRRQFPGSWLPYGFEQIERTARPRFRTVNKSSGRLDYIETIHQWGMRYRSFNLKKYAVYLSLVPRWLASAELRSRLSRDQVRANRQLFEREVLDHYRIVFEKI
ncbi:MAG: class I SAM-dependent methyltransferase [Spirochaetia bacterium]|jgi:cyclopropane-fatty-acyl-phospholipid synthase